VTAGGRRRGGAAARGGGRRGAAGGASAAWSGGVASLPLASVTACGAAPRLSPPRAAVARLSPPPRLPRRAWARLFEVRGRGGVVAGARERRAEPEGGACATACREELFEVLSGLRTPRVFVRHARERNRRSVRRGRPGRGSCCARARLQLAAGARAARLRRSPRRGRRARPAAAAPAPARPRGTRPRPAAWPATGCRSATRRRSVGRRSSAPVMLGSQQHRAGGRCAARPGAAAGVSHLVRADRREEQ
jgi:hypothetical protein